MYNRIIRLPLEQKNSIFLFGPRGTGKTSWLKAHLPNSLYFDLLDFSVYSMISADPSRLENLIPNGYKDWIILDEVQRVILPSGHVLITTPTRSPFSWLRNLLGSRIHTIRMDIWEAMIESMDWVCIGKKKTFLQVQYLLRT